MPRGGNHNTTGKNQWGTITSVDDPVLREALQRYHREGYTNNRTISELLLADFGIKLSESTVKRRRWTLGLFGSGKATKEIPETVKRQMVIDAINDDPKQHRGPRTIKQDIAQRTGIHLTRDFIHAVMQEVAPEGFQLRKPPPKRQSQKRGPSKSAASAGPHERWCVDHHSKLAKIGMEIYGIRDKASGKWLGLWAVPNRNIKEVVAFLYLCVVEAYGGIPLHTTTECASQDIPPAQYEFSDALQGLLLPEDPEVTEAADQPAQFIGHIQNVIVDKGWFGFSVGWGDNIVTFFDSGVSRGLYDAENQEHYMLAQWLWSTFLRGELVQIRDQMNSARILKRTSNKDSPTVGGTPNSVFTLPEKYGMADCLRPVDIEIVQQTKIALGGDALLEFVSPEYAMRASEAFRDLGIGGLTYHSIWDVFEHMLPAMIQQEQPQQPQQASSSYE